MSEDIEGAQLLRRMSPQLADIVAEVTGRAGWGVTRTLPFAARSAGSGPASNSFERNATESMTARASRPTSALRPEPPSNSGRVETKDKQPQVIITWKPNGGGTTVEMFSMWGNEKAMSGTSNRFGPLQATKI